MKNTNPPSPQVLLEALIKQINKDNDIIWKNLSLLFSKALGRNGEKIYDRFIYGWANYIKGEGIEVQSSAEPEEKLITCIHQYRQFIKGTSNMYSNPKQDIDGAVRIDILRLVRNIDKPLAKRITRLKKQSDFKKLLW